MKANGIKSQRQETAYSVKYLRSLETTALEDLKIELNNEVRFARRQGFSSLELGFQRLVNKVSRIIEERKADIKE